jgi:ankyrin repeat protein
MPAPVDQIIAASLSGDRAGVAALLAQDAALATASTMLGSTAVHAAHYSNHPDIVRLLLTHRPLDGFLAAELGLATELGEWLQRRPDFVRERNASGATALHGACYWGSLEAARLLLDQGADVQTATADSFLQIHPLGCAVATADVPNPSDDESVVLSLVELLLDRGADVNARRRDGMTALHSAAYRGHLRVIRRLVERGADVNARAHDAGPHARQSPLDTALAHGQSAAADLLRRLPA